MGGFKSLRERRAYVERFSVFLDRYICDEHQLFISGLSERNVSLFKQNYEAFESKYYEYGIVNYQISTPKQPYDKYFERGKRMIEASIPRIIFQVKKYEHPQWGMLYRCYLSTTSPSKRMKKDYAENFFVYQLGDEYKIISIYTLPPELTKLNPDLREWEYSRGKTIEELGTLLKVKKYHPTEDPTQLEEYQIE